MQPQIIDLRSLVRCIDELDVWGVERSVWQSRDTTRGRFRQRMEAWAPLIDATLHLGPQLLAHAPSSEAAAELITALRESGALDALAYGLDDGLSYIGHEVGYFYGGQPWGELCRLRSTIAFLRVLVTAHPDLVEALDTLHEDELLARFGIEMLESVVVPPGMPARHWWWFRESPPP